MKQTPKRGDEQRAAARKKRDELSTCQRNHTLLAQLRPHVPSVQLSPRDDSPTPAGRSCTHESPRLDVVLASIELGTLSVSLSDEAVVAGLAAGAAVVCCR